MQEQIHIKIYVVRYTGLCVYMKGVRGGWGGCFCWWWVYAAVIGISVLLSLSSGQALLIVSCVSVCVGTQMVCCDTHRHKTQLQRARRGEAFNPTFVWV